jgi:predicted RNA-binding Zn ribbon-like protein
VPAGKRQTQKFELDGGTVALDFVNTVSGLRVTAPREKLAEFADLIDWAEQSGLLDRRAAARLRDTPPASAPALLDQARALREALHQVIAASLAGRAPPAGALAAVNCWTSDALAARRLHPKPGGGFEVRFANDRAPLAFLRPVAIDAWDLLERELAGGRVRLCDEAEYGRCGWLFLDQTKNASRRFCSMTDCGNRAKQRRFQERRRGGG